MQTTNWLPFFDIDYGGLDGGVFTAACLPEALHLLEQWFNPSLLEKTF